MFNKFEIVGGAICVALMAATVFLIQTQGDLNRINDTQPAALVAATPVVVPNTNNDRAAQAAALLEASDNINKLERMVIDDIKVGTGAEVQNGDAVAVHYIGRLQDGTEFDNSNKRGAPIEFTVGTGRVIAGWEQGVLGMQVGGERILVIPPELAYGDAGVGPIPPNSTLIFSLELVSIN